MSLSSGLLALMLLGGDGPDRRAIEYHVQLVEMKGLEWRGTMHERLTPVARRANCAVWTAGRDVADELVKAAERVVGTPRVNGQVDTPATIRFDKRRNVVADVHRVADGPVNHASAVAFRHEMDQVAESFQATISARQLEQGVLARVAIEDTRFVALHTVSTGETVHAVDKGQPPTSLHAQFQVPEVVTGRVDGEWLIPSRGVLVVSLGAHTTADAKGKAVVHDRLALVRATVSPSASVDTFSAFRDAPPAIPPRWFGLMQPTPMADNQIVRASMVPATGPVFPSPAVAVPIAGPAPIVAMPAVPTRTLPPAFDPAGLPVALPPLPDPEVEPADFVESSEPRPSPQFRPIPGRPDTIEPQSSIRYNVRPLPEGERLHFPIIKLVLAPSPASGVVTEGSSAEPFRFRVPMLGGLCGLQVGTVREVVGHDFVIRRD